MKVNHSADLPNTTLPNGALRGVKLVTERDYKGFTVYEARIAAKSTVPLKTPDNCKSVHFYYCITGKGKCHATGRAQRDISPDTVVALSSDVTFEMTVSAEGAMRLLVVYYPDEKKTYRSLSLVRSLSEVVGTERDIDFGNGHSRRYITKQDGFPLSVHNTWVYPKTSSKLCYLNHVESAYCISGAMTYRWQDTSGEWLYENTRTDRENGTNYLLNMHDEHVVKIHDKDAYCICIFDPVLSGKENHQLTDSGFSGYEACS